MRKIINRTDWQNIFASRTVHKKKPKCRMWKWFRHAVK